MANYSNLKAAINAVIKQNGQGEITGEVMNQVLTAMVNSLGNKYQFAGVATPSTNPGTPDQNVFYMATQAGTYTNFSAIVLQAGISILLWDGSWSNETFFEIDSVPESGSDNFISSGAVFDKFKVDGGAYDVSAHNNNQTFASLSALLNDANLSTLIPTNIRSGGMSIKFVQSSDNKYVQYRLMSATWSTTVSDWQGVDDELIPGSQNLIKSGEVYNAIGGKKINFSFISETTGRVINSNVWTQTSTVTLLMIPISDYQGCQINIKAGDNEDAIFAFLTSLVPGDIGTTPAWADGENGIHILKKHTSNNYTVPSNATCLYFVKKSSNNIDRTVGAAVIPAIGLYKDILDTNDTLLEKGSSYTQDITAQLTINGTRRATTGLLIPGETTYSGTNYIRVNKGDIIQVYGFGYESVIAGYGSNNANSFVSSLLTRDTADCVNTKIEITDDTIKYIIVTIANNTNQSYISGSYVKIFKPLNKEVKDLAENISNNYNSKQDTVDNLYSDDTQKPLSANQGKVLNNKLFENNSIFLKDVTGNMTITGIRNATVGTLNNSVTTYSGTAYIPVNVGDIIYVFGLGYDSVVAAYSTNSIGGFIASLLTVDADTPIDTYIEIRDIRIKYVIVTLANSTHTSYSNKTCAKILKKVTADTLTESLSGYINIESTNKKEYYNYLISSVEGLSSTVFDYYGGIDISKYSKIRVKMPIVTYSASSFGNSGCILHNDFDEQKFYFNHNDFTNNSVVKSQNIKYNQQTNTVEYLEIETDGAKYISLPYFIKSIYTQMELGDLEILGRTTPDDVWEYINNNCVDINNIKKELGEYVRDVPKNITILNGYKKAKQMLNIQWTPLLGTIPDRFGSENYAANVKQVGVPYSAVLETHTYIPQNVSFYTFASAINNPYSLIYTENVSGNNSRSAIGKTYHGNVPEDGQRGTYMGSTCSVLIGYCLGFKRVIGASAMYRMTDVFVPIYDQSAQGVELMDVLLSTGHGILITDIWRTKRGEVVKIKTIEEVGNVRETTYTAESFNQFIRENRYVISRYKDLYKNTEYNPSPVVAVTDEGEPEVHPVFNSDICVFKGDRCSFAEGDVIRVNFFGGEYQSMELYKDNVLIQTITELDSSTHYVDLTSLNLTYGKYKARMKKSDDSYSDYTYWEILDCNVTYNKDTSTVTVLSQNAVARNAYYVRITGNIKQGMDINDISDGSFEFVPTFDVSALTEKVYLIVEFFGEYGGVINSFLDTELYIE